VPDIIVGDFDSIRPEVKIFYEKKKVKMLIRKDQDNTDLDKCLYISMEKLGTLDEQQIQQANSKTYALIILGSSGGRIDHTFSTYHHVFKYLNYYSDQLTDTEVYMISKSSMSVFLKGGVNIIESSETIQNKEFGYSIIPICGEANVTISDTTNNFKETKGMFMKVNVRALAEVRRKCVLS
jgi:thiamine pyrophosphokinase